jgi:predicted permease
LIGQVACAVVLLVGAGLFSKSLTGLRAADLGFQTEGVSIAHLSTRPVRDRKIDSAAYSRALVERLSALPGVKSVGFSFEGPLLGIEAAEWMRPVARGGAPAGTGETEATFVAISPDYLRTMGVPLRAGRDFRSSDDSRHPPVAIVSAALAEKLFGGDNPIGEPIRIESEPRLQHVEVIGVSRDASLADVHAKTPRFVFLPLLQASSSSAQLPSTIVVRATGSFATLQPALRRTVDSLGQHYVVLQRTLNDQIDRSLIRERWLAMGSDAFAALATVLVAIGLCGVIGSIVAARTREIGIRAALGASPPRLRWMVLRQAARIGVAGLAIGLPCAWIASRLMTSALTDVSPHDPFTFAAVPVVILAVILGAAWLPARRASSVDPIEALRSE